MTDNVRKTKDDLQQESVDFIYSIVNGIKTVIKVGLFFIAFFFIYMCFFVR